MIIDKFDQTASILGQAKNISIKGDTLDSRGSGLPSQREAADAWRPEVRQHPRSRRL